MGRRRGRTPETLTPSRWSRGCSNMAATERNFFGVGVVAVVGTRSLMMMMLASQERLCDDLAIKFGLLWMGLGTDISLLERRMGLSCCEENGTCSDLLFR